MKRIFLLFLAQIAMIVATAIWTCGCASTGYRPLSVTLNPPEVRNQARWFLDGDVVEPDGRDSGEAVFVPGPQVVTFKRLPGYLTPAPLSAAIGKRSVTYRKLP